MTNNSEHVFDPVRLSLEENAWLLRHLGEPWIVASRDVYPKTNPLADPKKDKNPVIYPDGVNPAAVRPVVERVYDLIELEKQTGSKWVGVDVIRKATEIYLQQAARWSADKRRGAPRFPTLFNYDTKGRPHWSGPGSDSGQVRTYFGPDGKREAFAIEYVPSGEGTWVAEWAEGAGENADKPETGLVVNKDLARIECFCGHTEKFNVDSRASFNAARARISKHLRSDKKQEFVEQHRELHTNEFGGR